MIIIIIKLTLRIGFLGVCVSSVRLFKYPTTNFTPGYCTMIWGEENWAYNLNEESNCNEQN